MRMRPIAIVSNEIQQNRKFEAEDVVSEIVVSRKYKRALDGIESFSHIIVLFWLHEITAPERSILKVHPRRNNSIPLTGVFATRSPVRPNPIGITTVRLLERKDNILRVKGLDAINGTPVLDIKPYLPESFPASEVTVAEWSKR